MFVIKNALRKHVRSAFNIGNDLKSSKQVFNPMARSMTVWEPSRKGRYEVEQESDERSIIWHIRNGWRHFIPETKRYFRDWDDMLDPKWYKPGDRDYKWTFRNEEDFKKWKTGSDSDFKEGNSFCDLSMSKNNTAIFKGMIDTNIIQDGKLARSGFCAMGSLDFRRSFWRSCPQDWTFFTHLVLRIRGDGRSYMLCLKSETTYDLTWHDLYNYPMYTRGGPYWQDVKVPFSKFALVHKGRVQEKGMDMDLTSVLSLTITLGDGNTGPFNLEIEKIGVEVDPIHDDTFVYESYHVPPFY